MTKNKTIQHAEPSLRERMARGDFFSKLPFHRRSQNHAEWQAREDDNRRLHAEMRAAIEEEFDATSLPESVRDAIWEVVTQHADSYTGIYDEYNPIVVLARLAYSEGGANR